MSERNLFLEGRDAYQAWFDNLVTIDREWRRQGRGLLAPFPICPYGESTPEARDWEIGFDDAMEWQLHGQYLDIS